MEMSSSCKLRRRQRHTSVRCISCRFLLNWHLVQSPHRKVCTQKIEVLQRAQQRKEYTRCGLGLEQCRPYKVYKFRNPIRQASLAE